MDSVTQFILGAGIGGAVLGPRIGARGLLVGGVLATLPDMDGFIPYDDPIDSMTYHRGFTHSLIVQTLATPVLALGITAVMKRARVHWQALMLTVFLCLTTHALLDSLTTYGTQLFWPFRPPPAAYPSVFIIDPFYTLTLLVGVLAVAFRRRKPDRGLMVNRATLILSSAYLAVGMAGHAMVESRAADHPQFAGQRLHVQPAPLNILFWQVTGVSETRYTLGNSLIFPGCPVTHVQSVPRAAAPPEGFPLQDSARRLEWFTDGFYTYTAGPERLTISDLRIGLERALPFTFLLGERQASGYTPVVPPRQTGGGVNAGGTLSGMLRKAGENWRECWN